MKTRQSVEFRPEIETLKGSPIAQGTPILVPAGSFVRVLLTRGDRRFVQYPDSAEAMAGAQPVFRWLHRTDLEIDAELGDRPTLKPSQVRRWPEPGDLYRYHKTGSLYTILKLWKSDRRLNDEEKYLWMSADFSDRFWFISCSAIALGEVIVFYQNEEGKVFARSIDNFLDTVSGVCRFTLEQAV